MNSSNRRVELQDLERVHQLATQRYPHEYLDEGLGAIGLFLYDPPQTAGYGSTPTNSISFAGLGVDGIHFGCITESGAFDPAAPIVMTIPMALENPNYIVGESLYDFLCLGCRHGFSNLGNLHLDHDGVLEQFAASPGTFFDDRSEGILQFMRDELLLEPWVRVRERLENLQSGLIQMLKLPGSN